MQPCSTGFTTLSRIQCIVKQLRVAIQFACGRFPLSALQALQISKQIHNKARNVNATTFAFFNNRYHHVLSVRATFVNRSGGSRLLSDGSVRLPVKLPFYFRVQNFKDQALNASLLSRLWSVGILQMIPSALCFSFSSLHPKGKMVRSKYLPIADTECWLKVF